MRILVLVAVVLTLTAACNPTGSPRCDQVLPAQNAAIAAHGWTLRCDPDAPDLRYDPPAWVQGYADPSKMVVALWPDRIASDLVLRKQAWHELGHVVFDDRPRGTVNEEWWADGFAWCVEPIAGVSYMNMPTDCGPYA